MRSPSQQAVPTTPQVTVFQRRILEWYETQQRRFPWRHKTASTYAKIVAELLLQRTQAATIAKFLPAFLKQFPSWKALSQADEDALRAYLQPIGLWRRRATTFHNLANEMVRRRGIMPKDRTAIEDLPGVGQYIANAIELFAHGTPRPLLDGNMARVLERHYGPRTLVDIRYDPYLQTLAHRIVKGIRAAAVNWAILDLAATICTTTKPSCHQCPLRHTCQYANTPRHASPRNNATPAGKKGP
jgi:A/G-specific adenine glycosylase